MTGFCKAAPVRRRSILAVFAPSVVFLFSAISPAFAELQPVTSELAVPLKVRLMLQQERDVEQSVESGSLSGKPAFPVQFEGAFALPAGNTLATAENLRFSEVLKHPVDLASLRLNAMRSAYPALLVDETKLEKEWGCLVEALYFEARGENMQGQIAVAEVILNRVKSRRFPDTICKVISQGASRRNACQFSFKCDGRPEEFNEHSAYERVSHVADMMMDGRSLQITGGATFYHTTAVRPGWSRRLSRTTRIGDHLFYRYPARSAQN